MPEVPGASYEPYFTAQPTERPIPEPNIQAVPAAFGESVAKATQLFGGELEQASTEVFNRALAFRKLDIETKVRDAVTKLSNNMSPVMADYLSAKGANASQDVLNQHLATIEGMRQDARAGVSQYGVYGQKMFDDEFASMQRSFIRESTNHAAQENKSYISNEAEAAVGAAEDRVRNAPSDQHAFDDELKNLPSSISRQAAANGWGQQQSDRKLGIATSKLVVARVEGLARKGDYTSAWQFYKAHEGLVLGEDQRDQVTKIVNDAENHRAASDIGQAVSRGFAPYMSRKEVDATNGVETPLLEVFKRAQRKLADDGIQVTIGDKGGVRTPAEQAELVRRGVSKTEDSDHLTGRAIDITPRNANGTPNYTDTKSLAAIDAAVRASAQELNVPLKPQISWDKYHYGLEKGWDVSTAPKFPQESQSSKVSRAQTYAENTFGDHNPYIGQYATANVVQNDNIQKSSDREQQFRARQTLTEAVFGLGAQGQKPATTLDELFANGGAAATEAWKQADPTLQQAIMDKMAKVAKGENIQWTKDGLNRYRELLYMEDHDTNNFIMNNMIAEQGIPTRQIVDLLKRQERALSRKEADPRVGAVAEYLNDHYAQEMSGMTPDNKKRYYGAVKSGVEEFNDIWGHAPRTPEDFEMIHKFASSSVSEPGTIWGTNTYDVWDRMPPKVLDKYQEQFPKESDEQLLMRYQKDQAAILFNQYYGKYGKKGIGSA